MLSVLILFMIEKGNINLIDHEAINSGSIDIKIEGKFIFNLNLFFNY